MSASRLSSLHAVFVSPRTYLTLLILAITCAPGLAAISLTAAAPIDQLNSVEYELACCCCCPPCCCPPCCCENFEPTISFSAIYDSCEEEWVLVGTVEDEDPANCTVYFGGVLDGHEAEVDEFGNFEYRIDEAENGLVSAIAEDLEGLASEEEYDEITAENA